MNYLLEYLSAFGGLFVQMAPYLLLGFLFAGILHVVVRRDTLARHLGRPGFGSALKAALLGLPLPLCSCSVIPTGLALRQHGASNGAAVAFLIATPQTGVDSILATSALLGVPMAIMRAVSAFITGVLGGWITDGLIRAAPSPEPARSEPTQSEIAATGDHNNNETPPSAATLTAKIAAAFRYGFIEMLRNIAKWLLLGLAVAALLTLVVPDDFFTRYLQNYWLSVALVLLVALPLYVCATGSIPIALALMMKGLSPGVAFVFLMAGPATMASTIAVVGKVLGRKTLTCYLASIVAGAVFFGYLIDAALPAAWFQVAHIHHGAHVHGDGILPEWFSYACAVFLGGLLLNAARDPRSAGEAMMNAATYSIDTITCQHCQRTLEQAVGAVAGVEKVVADIATSTLKVQGAAAPENIRAAIEKAGYRVKQS
ncbi:MAG: SO_0444 family Cu/Zn efflux transporter [Planctomycetota bacterium]|jgi:uncharacterized membrane protein YraQ (UPF0718 family)/copper chaperone CopZ|nr:SO_0444 family Cu/Zn efflux transporter [Planctomycetota bacterium]